MSSSTSARDARQREDLEKVKNDASNAQYAKVDRIIRHQSSSRPSRADLSYDAPQRSRDRHRDGSRSPFRHDRHSHRKDRSRSPWRPQRQVEASKSMRTDDDRDSATAAPETSVNRATDASTRKRMDALDTVRDTHGTTNDLSGHQADTAQLSLKDSPQDSTTYTEATPENAPVSRLAKRKRIAEVMAEANARQKRLTPPSVLSPAHYSSLHGSGPNSSRASTLSPAPESAQAATQSGDQGDALQANTATMTGNSQLDSDAPAFGAAVGPEGQPSGFVGESVADDASTFMLEKDNSNPTPSANETSAADYNPNEDMHEDRPDHKVTEYQDSAQTTDPSDPPVNQSTLNEAPKSFDMFADEDDDDDDDIDMFAPLGAPKDSVSKVTVAPAAGLQHDYDDLDGYLRVIQREVLDDRYSIRNMLGKGVFASVVLAEDLATKTKVAIKIARNNDTMLKAAQHELRFLQLLQERDGSKEVPIIRLLDHFTHKKHLCLVFEKLDSDLRELLKKHGRNTGLDISAVKAYARQMFHALHHLEKAEVLHADLKPDNILASSDHKYIKICDLGSAMFLRDAEPTDMLVSRFYRAPEIMIGSMYSYPIDMWAIGCTLFELYTGRILFNGQDNNRMLRMIQECRGKIPSRMIKKAVLPTGHFSPDNTFIGEETNSATGKTVSKPVYFQQPVFGKDLRSRLAVGIPARSGDAKKDADAKRLHDDFVDLLDQCLKLDPEQRIRPSQALKHRFFQAAPTKAPVAKIPALPFLPTSVLKRD